MRFFNIFFKFKFKREFTSLNYTSKTRDYQKKKNTSKMEVEAKGTQVRLVNEWRNLLSLAPARIQISSRVGSWETIREYRFDFRHDTLFSQFHTYARRYRLSLSLAFSFFPDLLSFPPRTSFASPVTRLLYRPHSSTHSHILH